MKSEPEPNPEGADCPGNSMHDPSGYAQRLHDGWRLLSDDFGELNEDESVTYQKQEEDPNGF